MLPTTATEYHEHYTGPPVLLFASTYCTNYKNQLSNPMGMSWLPLGSLTVSRWLPSKNDNFLVYSAPSLFAVIWRNVATANYEGQPCLQLYYANHLTFGMVYALDICNSHHVFRDNSGFCFEIDPSNRGSLDRDSRLFRENEFSFKQFWSQFSFNFFRYYSRRTNKDWFKCY